MKRIAIFAVLAIIGVSFAAESDPAQATKKKTVKKKTAIAKKTVRATPVPASVRLSAREEIDRKLGEAATGFEDNNPLLSFFERLDQSHKGGAPVHILQFGDSHTASDDWVNSMRTAAQKYLGDGGPGFVQAGHPYRGYRRFDATGANTPGWKTEGTMQTREDPNQGLSGISISTDRAGQTVSLGGSGQALEIFYLRQPGGGKLEVQVDDQIIGMIATDGDSGSGAYQTVLNPGPHQLLLRTLENAPVRLFGWALDNPHGITFETLGINGAQASIMLEWNEQVWSAAVAARNPALVILAYGTNEANSPKWTEAQYRADLLAVLDRVRRAAPSASILMVGPPDCGRLRPLAHLAEVIEVQRDVAKAQNVAFFDWRAHMGGAGMMKRWVQAGLAQADYIHLSSAGYQTLGKMLFDQLERAYSEFHE